MAGKIIADTLTHSTAGSVTTDYVVNGSAKAWSNYNGTGTVALRDSLNISTLTDNGTGDYQLSFTSSMGNSNYNVTSNGTHDDGSYVVWPALDHDGGARTTSAYFQNYLNSSTVLTDTEHGAETLHGDLA